jgi:hypothetical protein
MLIETMREHNLGCRVHTTLLVNAPWVFSCVLWPVIKVCIAYAPPCIPSTVAYCHIPSYTLSACLDTTPSSDLNLLLPAITHNQGFTLT